MDANPTTDLDSRDGWPDELRVLLKQYPRETWRSSPSQMARFWLDKHDAFREQGRLLGFAGEEFRAGTRGAVDFGAWIAPRLQAYLSALHGHHQIEDFHYFPAFRAAEQRLATGFDALARDHEQLHAGIVEIVETVNAFLTTIRESESGGGSATTDAQRRAGERYADTADALLERLERHLDDEEDLIIPVMIDRGE